MQKFFITFLILALVVGLGVSTSCAGTYVSGNLGAVFLSDSDFSDGVDTGEFSFDTGFGLTGALGTTLDNGGRIEVELGYRTNDMDELTVDGFGTGSIKGDVSALSLMGNAYYDFSAGGKFTPFIGAGIGFAKVEADIDLAGNEDDTVFAYQLAFGGSYAVSENLNLDLQYRFFGTADPDFAGIEAEYNSHNLMVGFRRAF